ncbi:hypothetical protein CCHL11_02565 [Colletotrichum chlorophyti]|uniref:Uncharacterized protein n=1 Tax=Colletotrichum chlorophyti TaxID=708187 RepID=A0A1Q8S962_9PEZI|nr:hypothetical protein CCHL11_02565 [Colletotrichum chlorophyti]
MVRVGKPAAKAPVSKGKETSATPNKRFSSDFDPNETESAPSSGEETEEAEESDSEGKDETENKDESESEGEDKGEGEGEESEGGPVTPLPGRRFKTPDGNNKPKSNSGKINITKHSFRSEKAVQSIASTTVDTTFNTETDTGPSPFTDIYTPLHDSPIPINFKRRRRDSTPKMNRPRSSSSSSSSSGTSTPTRPPLKRRRTEPPKPKFATLAEAARRVKVLSAEYKFTKAEHLRVSEMYEHLMREENATPLILDAAVDATTDRLERALEEKEMADSGFIAREPEFFPGMIQQLEAAVAKAEADRDAWYAETREVFYLSTKLERDMPRIRKALIAAKTEEAAARERERGFQNPTPRNSQVLASSPGSSASLLNGMAGGDWRRATPTTFEGTATAGGTAASSGTTNWETPGDAYRFMFDPSTGSDMF